MSNAVLVLPPLFDTAAITAGALSGSLHASRRGLDVVGIFVVATMLRWLSMHYDLRTPRPVDLSPRLLRSRD